MPAKVKQGSLTIVHFVEQQLEGWTFERKHWPLHITLVPWFETQDEEAIMRSLDRLANETTPMTLTVGKLAKYGARKLPVNVIKNQKEISALHQLMLETLEGADISVPERKFTGKEYEAHISHHVRDGRHSNEGERVLMHDFHLVRLMDDNICQVDQVFELLGH